MSTRIPAGWTIAATLLLAGPAWAGEGLAPPGPCAKPDAANTLVRPLASAPRSGVDLRIHLVGLMDVAGPVPSSSLAGPPKVPLFPDRGPCDNPGSGCLGLIQPPPRPASASVRPAATRRVRESNPGPGKPPGIP